MKKLKKRMRQYAGAVKEQELMDEEEEEGVTKRDTEGIPYCIPSYFYFVFRSSVPMEYYDCVVLVATVVCF